LEGSLRKLPRVTKGESYPCQMQKNQNFSCLFRHYAKHNGLRKEDLIFSFVDELQADQTPETVHLMSQDEIWVEHRPAEEATSKDVTPSTTAFSNQFYALLETGNHSDVTFIVGEEKVEIRAHRAILSARCQYFQAMFREGAMCESREGVVRTMHEPSVFRHMLEFIYTNTVRNIDTLCASDLIALILLANEYLIDDLRRLSEKAAIRTISLDNIGRLLLLSTSNNGSGLREACSEFVRENKLLLAHDANFRQDIEQNPELGLLLFESSLPRLPVIEGGEDSVSSTAAVAGNKRRRIADHNSENEQDAPAVPAPAPQHQQQPHLTHAEHLALVQQAQQQLLQQNPNAAQMALVHPPATAAAANTANTVNQAAPAVATIQPANNTIG